MSQRKAGGIQRKLNALNRSAPACEGNGRVERHKNRGLAVSRSGPLAHSRFATQQTRQSRAGSNTPRVRWSARLQPGGPARSDRNQSEDQRHDRQSDCLVRKLIHLGFLRLPNLLLLIQIAGRCLKRHMFRAGKRPSRLRSPEVVISNCQNSH